MALILCSLGWLAKPVGSIPRVKTVTLVNGSLGRLSNLAEGTVKVFDWLSTPKSRLSASITALEITPLTCTAQ